MSLRLSEIVHVVLLLLRINFISASEGHFMATLSKAIEPTTRAFLETINAIKGPALYEIPVEEGRKVFAQLQAIPVNKLPVDIEDSTVTGGPTGSVPIRILRPKGATKALH